MNLEITVRHGSADDLVKQHATKKLDRVLNKYSKGLISVHLILDEEKQRHSAEILAHGRHLTATVHAECDDARAAIDRAADKLRHQLERHHDRRVARKKRGARRGDRMLAEAEVALAVPVEEPEPAVARRAVAAATLSLPSAITALEEDSAPFLLFREETGGPLRLLQVLADGELELLEVE
ncbi:MAG: ribosome-associated translation inhibitor RaiA [Acidobacteriota bacterium]